jgi:hypothetical protein
MKVCKIQWYTWDSDKLVIQAVTKSESIQIGSVKYTYTGITTKEQVDQIIEDTISGKIK